MRPGPHGVSVPVRRRDQEIDGTGDFSSGVFWGVAPTPIAAGDNNIAARPRRRSARAGSWTQLMVAANAPRRWTAAGGRPCRALRSPKRSWSAARLPAPRRPRCRGRAGIAPTGGTVEWGPVGRISSDGREPCGLPMTRRPARSCRRMPRPTGPTATTAGWPPAPAGTETPVIEDDFGTAATGLACAPPPQSLRFVRAGHRPSSTIWVRLEVAGLDLVTSGLTRRSDATNDLIDLESCRPGKYLPGPAVGTRGGWQRLVTSPTMADLANRDEAHAAAVDVESYLETSYGTSPCAIRTCRCEPRSFRRQRHLHRQRRQRIVDVASTVGACAVSVPGVGVRPRRQPSRSPRRSRG